MNVSNVSECVYASHAKSVIFCNWLATSANLTQIISVEPSQTLAALSVPAKHLLFALAFKAIRAHCFLQNIQMLQSSSKVCEMNGA